MKLYTLFLCIMSTCLPIFAQGPADIYAAAKKSPQALEKLLARGVLINSVDDLGRTALYMAAQSGDADSVRLLLDHKADPNAVDLMTPLIAATKIGRIDIVTMLINKGANITTVDMWEKTALSYAQEGQWEIIIPLVTSDDAGPSHNAHSLELESDFIETDIFDIECPICKDVDTEDNPLVPVSCVAQHIFHEQCIAYWKTLSGDCPLCKECIQATTKNIFKAAQNGADSLQAHLSKFKASIDMQDDEGLTALMVAAREGDIPTVKILLAHKAQALLTSESGKTALRYAQERGHFIAALEKTSGT